METMYERISKLCEENNTNITRMCKDIGISRSSLSELQSGRTKMLSADKLQKIADYFDVTIGYLMGTDESEQPKITDEEIKFALFGGEVSDESYEEVKRFVEYIKNRDKMNE